MVTSRIIIGAFLLLALSNQASALLINPAGMPTMSAAPQNPASARHVEGLQSLEKNDLVSAEQAFRESMQLDPKAPQPLLGMADLALRKKKPTEAWGWLDKALKLAPQNGLVYQAIGRYHFANHDYSKAIEALKEAQRLEPKSALILIDQGEIYIQGPHRPDLAVTAYRDALRIDPQHAGAHYGLGSALVASGKVSEAESEFNQAATLAPENFLPQLALARLYAKNNPDKALQSLDKALALQPGLFDALMLQGDLLDANGQRDKAVKAYQSAASTAPKLSLPHLKIGLMAHREGQGDLAVSSYKKVIELDPKQAIAYNNLASIAVEHNQILDQAENWARKAVALEPNVADYHDTLGWTLRARKNAKGGLASLQKAAQLNPKNPEIQYHLGMLYAETGDKIKASEALKRALGISAHFPSALNAKKLLKDLER